MERRKLENWEKDDSKDKYDIKKDHFRSYGEDTHGVLPGEERDDLNIHEIEGGTGEEEDEEVKRDNRRYRDDLESKGSQDPY